MNDRDCKIALARMLPDHVGISEESGIFWRVKSLRGNVTETEMLHVCRLVETSLGRGGMISDFDRFENALAAICSATGSTSTSATWQERAEALCKVKGISP